MFYFVLMISLLLHLKLGRWFDVVWLAVGRSKDRHEAVALSICISFVLKWKKLEFFFNWKKFEFLSFQ